MLVDDIHSMWWAQYVFWALRRSNILEWAAEHFESDARNPAEIRVLRHSKILEWAAEYFESDARNPAGIYLHNSVQKVGLKLNWEQWPNVLGGGHGAAHKQFQEGIGYTRPFAPSSVAWACPEQAQWTSPANLKIDGAKVRV